MATKEEMVSEAMGELETAVGAVINAFYDKVEAAGFDRGVASVPQLPGGGFSQEQVDSLVAEGVAKAKAESQQALDTKQAELDKALSDDASDKAAIAAKQEILDQIRILLPPAQPVQPSEPVPETPVEEQQP